MSFLDGLPDVLAPSADEVTEVWVESGIAKLNADVLPQLAASIRPSAQAMIDTLSANKGVANSVTHAGLTTIVGYLALDASDDAKLVFIAEQASFDERQNALLAAMRAARQANDETEAAWQSVKQLALDILKAAGQAAIPLLLSLV
jgi:hypothetical protein